MYKVNDRSVGMRRWWRWHWPGKKTDIFVLRQPFQNLNVTHLMHSKTQLQRKHLLWIYAHSKVYFRFPYYWINSYVRFLTKSKLITPSNLPSTCFTVQCILNIKIKSVDIIFMHCLAKLQYFFFFWKLLHDLHKEQHFIVFSVVKYFYQFLVVNKYISTMKIRKAYVHRWNITILFFRWRNCCI